MICLVAFSVGAKSLQDSIGPSEAGLRGSGRQLHGGRVPKKAKRQRVDGKEKSGRKRTLTKDERKRGCTKSSPLETKVSNKVESLVGVLSWVLSSSAASERSSQLGNRAASQPSATPSSKPSASLRPSSSPSTYPSSQPSESSSPTGQPSYKPSSMPSSSPNTQPTCPDDQKLCDNDGTVTCMLACKGAEGLFCPNATYIDEDNCNSCMCGVNGTGACTRMFCGGGLAIPVLGSLP